jgi:hypothetical protein
VTSTIDRLEWLALPCFISLSLSLKTSGVDRRFWWLLREDCHVPWYARSLDAHHKIQTSHM